MCPHEVLVDVMLENNPGNPIFVLLLQTCVRWANLFYNLDAWYLTWALVPRNFFRRLSGWTLLKKNPRQDRQAYHRWNASKFFPLCITTAELEEFFVSEELGVKVAGSSRSQHNTLGVDQTRRHYRPGVATPRLCNWRNAITTSRHHSKSGSIGQSPDDDGHAETQGSTKEYGNSWNGFVAQGLPNKEALSCARSNATDQAAVS